jgi:nitronate monooxygenase
LAGQGIEDLIVMHSSMNSPERDMRLSDKIRSRLQLPLIAAPMFLVSSVELVVASCRSGVIGAFPTANCRTATELDSWLANIRKQLDEHEAATGERAAPYCPNLIVHKSSARLAEDLAIMLKHKPELVITSVGSPASVIGDLHEAGVLVFADVATLKQAHKAAEAGADGLILLTAGAGGHTGWLNPFAFVRAVRAWFDKTLVLAGGISDGYALAAARLLGCDLGYMGTRFIATTQSAASPAYKEMVVASTADDIILSPVFSGQPANILRGSLLNAGLDPLNLPVHGPLNIAADFSVAGHEKKPKAWKEIWSAGHSAAGVQSIVSVEQLVAQTLREYRSARAPAGHAT